MNSPTYLIASGLTNRAPSCVTGCSGGPISPGFRYGGMGRMVRSSGSAACLTATLSFGSLAMMAIA